METDYTLLSGIDLDLRKEFVSIAAKLRARRVFGYECLSVEEAGRLQIDVTQAVQSASDPALWHVIVAVGDRRRTVSYEIKENGAGQVTFLREED